MINKVILVGRLTKDIEIKVSQSGKKYCQFTLAVQRDKENADFIGCLAWEKTAELMSMYLSKGSQIAVEGRIQTRSYDTQTGKNYVTDVVVQNMQFLDSKKETTQVPVPVQTEAPLVITSDDLPF